jgi:hypothetical protein
MKDSLISIILTSTSLYGTSGAIATKTINGNPEIMELDFYQPIIVPWH